MDDPLSELFLDRAQDPKILNILLLSKGKFNYHSLSKNL